MDDGGRGFRLLPGEETPDGAMRMLAGGLTDAQLAEVYGMARQSAGRLRERGFNPTVGRFSDYLRPFGARLCVLMDDGSAAALARSEDEE